MRRQDRKEADHDHLGWRRLFKAKMADARRWRNIISAIASLIEEASFTVSPTGIELRAMDPSHVAMVDFEMSKSSFDEYDCEAPTRLDVNLNEMLKFLRRIESDEPLELSFDEKTARLNIILSGKYLRNFTIPTLEIAGEKVPTPKISFNAKARVTTYFLKNAINDAYTVSDHIRFEATSVKFVIRAAGDPGSVLIELDEGSEALLGLEVGDEANATFGLSYLNEIVGAASTTSDIVTIEFSTNMPVKLSFEMPHQEKLQYFVAPRIEGAE